VIIRPLQASDAKKCQRAAIRESVTGGTAASSGASDSRVSRVTHTHTLVQKTGVSPVRRHWRAQQRDVSILEGGRGDTGRGLRDGIGLNRSVKTEIVAVFIVRLTSVFLSCLFLQGALVGFENACDAFGSAPGQV